MDASGVCLVQCRSHARGECWTAPRPLPTNISLGSQHHPASDHGDLTVHSSAPASAGAGQNVSWTPLAVALYAWTYHMPSVASNLCNGVDVVQFGIRLAAKQRWLWYVLF